MINGIIDISHSTNYEYTLAIFLDLLDITTIMMWSYFRGGLIIEVVFVKGYLLI